jgi:uncharacterized damage-inducible protein DinB
MRLTEMLLEQLNRAFGGRAWHGPPLRDLLDGVTPEQAAAHPIEGAHSILEIVVHTGTWMDVVARRIAGSEVELTTEEDWSDVTKHDWNATVEELEHAQSRLADAVARLSTDRLNELIPGRSHNIHAEILGVIQHNIYHAGQIAILKKVGRLGGKPKRR